MKKIIITVVLILVPSLFFAQTTPFDEFDGRDHVTSVVVSKKMFEMMGKFEMSKDNEEIQQYIDLLKKLDNLKVFITTNSEVVGDMKTAVNKYLTSNTMEELIRVNSEGKKVKVYVKSGVSETKIRELLMFIEGERAKETVLMSTLGDFDINEISVLINKMNIPGGEELKRVQKNK